jgi:hypothetical protein
MKTNAYYLALSALSNESTKFAQDNFGDNWFVTVTDDRVQFKMTRSGYGNIQSFHIALNSDRVPMLEFPRMTINFPAAGNDSNFWLMRYAV